MWYLLLSPDALTRISYSLCYLAFSDYELAMEYAVTHGFSNCIITDDITFFVGR